MCTSSPGRARLVAHRGRLRGADDLAGHRVAVTQVGDIVSAQDARDRARRHPELGAEHVRALTVSGAGGQDLLLDLLGRPGRHGVWTARPVTQPGFALGLVAGDPGGYALTGHAHGGGDMARAPTILKALDDQPATMDGQAGVTVGHENLRGGRGHKQATSHPEVLPSSTRLACYQPPGRVQQPLH